jgi:hypothetical protein
MMPESVFTVFFRHVYRECVSFGDCAWMLTLDCLAPLYLCSILCINNISPFTALLE